MRMLLYFAIIIAATSAMSQKGYSECTSYTYLGSGSPSNCHEDASGGCVCN